jgi:polyhydroxyalkanoate synthesis regulator phasin
MSKKIMASLAAAVILIGAGIVFSIVSTPAIAVAGEDSADDGAAPRVIGFLQRVLDQLVAEGTIEEQDAEAVLSAVEDELAELREQRHELARPRRHLLRMGARIGALLDDGGISQDEYDSLPEDSRLRDIDVGDALDDGLITPEELREILREHRRG